MVRPACNMKMRKKSSDSLEPARRAYTREKGQKEAARRKKEKDCLAWRAERCGGEQRETTERGEGEI